ncbi:MAG: type II toxin-antitoxin system prevent-host-death family antitoxin [Verrucomicrobiota bacterium]|nr:type II toxin-antitoxin system prevent-host-death family antitoxin [Verrucomicrobiota bacterium]MDQ6939329.1 type II toxin-antitoxin system prevent-host-death family antitoxin [Verrucomicrobiota bacterium]
MKNGAVNIHAAKTRFSQLVARAEKGERIPIARNGKIVAQLGPARKPKRSKIPPDDPLLNLDKWGFDGPGGELTNKEIDRIVYGA